jgi:hypothetical protein
VSKQYTTSEDLSEDLPELIRRFFAARSIPLSETSVSLQMADLLNFIHEAEFRDGIPQAEAIDNWLKRTAEDIDRLLAPL